MGSRALSSPIKSTGPPGAGMFTVIISFILQEGTLSGCLYLSQEADRHQDVNACKSRGVYVHGLSAAWAVHTCSHTACCVDAYRRGRDV